MKNLTLTILLLITTTLFSQEKDNKTLIDELNNFYNRSKIEKLEVLTSEILSGKYGSIDDELKFYALMYSTNVFTSDNYTKKDPQKGYDKAIELIEFVKTTNYNWPNKDTYLKSMIDFMPEYIKKFPSVQTSKSNKDNQNSQNTLSSSSSNTENNTSTSDNKTVTLTVSGTGKTLEEARLNALRSAIEQAFGAFISSKTEILNDNLVKDEIVSVSSGNIEKYNIISQNEIPNNGFVITLSATVSIEKLTTFAESKGVVVEFKGGMFGLKIKLQKLNEDSEIIAIKNLTSACFDILNSAFDFELKVSEPVKANYSEDEYLVEFLVTTKENDNYGKFNNYFLETIKKIAIPSDEEIDYIKLNNPIYYFIINENKFAFRSKKTFMFLTNFLSSAQIFANSFKIFSNTETVKFNYSSIYNEFLSTADERIGRFKSQILLNTFYNPSYRYNLQYGVKQPYQRERGSFYLLSPKFVHLTKNFNLTKSDLLFDIWVDRSYNSRAIDEKSALIYETPFGNPRLKFVKRYKLSEIEKISEFKLEKIDIYDFLKNRNLYMLPEPEEDWSCFIGNTKIKTPKGNTNIQDIKVGDEVICFDDKGNLHTSIVESINEHDNQEVYKYSIWNGETLYATPNHWVLTSENSFSEIGKLNEMLTLVDINGGLKPITKVEYHGKQKVYNFIVKEFHTYIANDIRVHNGGKGKFKQKNN